MRKNDRAHWENIHAGQPATTVSWYQSHPRISLEMIAASSGNRDAPLIDVGGGASTLMDHLLDAGYRDLSLLDISTTAIARAKSRLGPRAGRVRWLEQDILSFTTPRRFALWHDRAVFHFLTAAADRDRYIRVMSGALRPGAHAIIATFDLQGPRQCSGLDVVRYSPESLAKELGDGYRLLESRQETHHTPTGVPQQFCYCRFRKN